MPSSFWSNTIWYIILGVTILVELIFILVKVRNKWRVLALYISLAGLVFSYEILIGGLHAYQYFPKIIPHSLYDDGVVGNYFSQFSVSATAMLIAVFKLNYYWYVIFAVAYGGIEELFLKLGIYVQYWYRTWMTVASLPLLFWIGKKVYESGSKHIRPTLLYIYIFLGLITLQAHTMWVFRLLGIFSFGPSLDVPPERSGLDSLISGSYYLIVFSTMMAIYFSKIKWVWKALTIVDLYIAHYIGFKLQLMYYQEGWFLAYTTIAIISLYLYICILDKMYGQANAE
jgi:hypothetical protein